jgi:monofunctional biosynthetic peptidoglycan transglycosylase
VEQRPNTQFIPPAFERAQQQRQQQTQPAMKSAQAQKTPRKITFLRCLKWFGVAVASMWLAAVVSLVLMKWIDPPTDAVHMQRRVQAIVHGKPYAKQYNFVPLKQISPNFQHAVVSAEDARFYIHHGFDWNAIQKAAEEDMDGGKLRGGSTITQQLVKNLFFGTGRSFVRKGAEFTLVPMAELILGKQRILELYMNVVEWGPGVYGADAACHFWYKSSARSIGREPAAKLAALLPSPLKRKPERMGHYSSVILRRMSQVGW